MNSLNIHLDFKVSRNILLQVVVIVCFFFQQFIFYLNGISPVQIEILKYELIIFYFFILQYSYRKFGTFNLYTVFLFTLFIFIYSRIFLDILGLTDWEHADLMDDVYFPFGVQFQILSLLITSLLFVNLGHSFIKKDERREEFQYEPSPQLERWSLILFALATPGTAYKYLLELKVILANGYLALYDGTLANLSYPVWTAGAGTLFICAYAIFLSSRPGKRKFIIISTIFFLLNFLNTLKGSRSKIFIPLLFMLWFYFTFYKNKPTMPFYKLVVIVLISVGFSQWMVAYRMGNDLIDPSIILLMFFIEQGISVLILGYMIYYKNIFVNTGYPYILGPLILFTGGGQTFETLQNSHFLAHKLTHFLSPASYYSGAGTGSSFLGEFYDLGLIAFVLLSILTGYLIAHMVIYIKKYRIMFLLSYFFVQSIIYMPRNSFFPLITELSSCIILYFVLLTIINRFGTPRLKLSR